MKYDVIALFHVSALDLSLSILSSVYSPFHYSFLLFLTLISRVTIPFFFPHVVLENQPLASDALLMVKRWSLLLGYISRG
jgi:hypothetical protein